MELHITENHLKILTLFTNGYLHEYYIREVYNKLNLGLQTAQRILDDLEEKGILSSEIKGNIRIFRLQNNQIARDYITLTEQYKKIIFLGNYPLISQVVEKIIPFVNGISIVFGSYAKKNAHEDSDLDICVIGECKKSEINNISRRYNISTSIFQYSYEIFEKEYLKDHLLKEVIQDHIIITQPDQFVRWIL